MIPYRETQAWRDQQADAIERNPLVDCDGCGDKTRWSELVEKPDSHRDDTPMLCPDCGRGADIPRLQRVPVEDRRERNRDLGEFGP